MTQVYIGTLLAVKTTKSEILSLSAYEEAKLFVDAYALHYPREIITIKSKDEENEPLVMKEMDISAELHSTTRNPLEGITLE